jgi:hypothetical protein
MQCFGPEQGFAQIQSDMQHGLEQVSFGRYNLDKRIPKLSYIDGFHARVAVYVLDLKARMRFTTTSHHNTKHSWSIHSGA